MTKRASLECSKLYLGTPYLDKGRDTNGWDCYGLFRYVKYERQGILLPSYDDKYTSATDTATVAPALDARHGAEWAAVGLGDEHEGDGVVFVIGGRPLHCGYVTEPGIMLHALRGRGTCLERYTSPLWQNRIEGIYRWQKKL